MQALDDMALLREYARHNSEAAFAELVSRRIGFVYSAALRQVRNDHLAGEITQAVFILLAQKAAGISEKTILTGWLFRTTRFAALAQMRAAAKHQRLAQELQMQTEPSTPVQDPLWEQMSPLLDEALAALGEPDRQAVLLRFFENKSLAEVGAALGTSEDTARKRTARALEKLHRYFNRHGVSSTTAIIGGAMSSHSVQAAPVALAKIVTAVAVAKGSIATVSTSTLVKGTMKLVTWLKIKSAIALGAAAILATGTTIVVTRVVAQNSEPSVDEAFWQLDSRTLLQAPPVLIIRPTTSARGGGGIEAGNRAVLINATVVRMLSVAYGVPESRMAVPDDLPAGQYDLMLTLADHPKEQLQAELKKRFGLAAHHETRETETLALKIVNASAPGIAPSGAGSQKSSGMSSSSASGNVPPEIAAKFPGLRNSGPGEQITMNNESLAQFARYLEQRLAQPVTDQTGATRKFDLQFRVQAKPGEPAADALKRSILEQLGLGLAASREPVDTLVVDKAP